MELSHSQEKSHKSFQLQGWISQIDLYLEIAFIMAGCSPLVLWWILKCRSSSWWRHTTAKMGKMGKLEHWFPYIGLGYVPDGASVEWQLLYIDGFLQDSGIPTALKTRCTVICSALLLLVGGVLFFCFVEEGMVQKVCWTQNFRELSSKAANTLLIFPSHYLTLINVGIIN